MFLGLLAEDCIIHAIQDLEKMEDFEVDGEVKLPPVGAVKIVNGVSGRPFVLTEFTPPPPSRLYKQERDVF